MRAAFLFLVLANVIFFGWTQGYFGEPMTGREPQRMSNQLHPESIRLLDEPVTRPVAPISLVCKRFRGFATALAAEALRIELLAALGEKGDWRVTLSSTAAVSEYWVGIPALATPALAEKKRSELVAAKFNNTTMIEEAKGGPFVILISKFDDEAGAKRFLEAQSKTLRTARVLARPREATPMLELRGPAKDFEQRATELLSARTLTAEACGGDDSAL